MRVLFKGLAVLALSIPMAGCGGVGGAVESVGQVTAEVRARVKAGCVAGGMLFGWDVVEPLPGETGGAEVFVDPIDPGNPGGEQGGSVDRGPA